MTTTDKYRIEIEDFENCKPTTAIYGWSDPEAAVNIAWVLLEAIANDRNLDIENQGDQFMAYYKDGHPDAEMGAVTIKVINERTNEVYDL